MAERIKGLQIDLSMRDMNVAKTLAGIKREFRSLDSSLKLSADNFKNSEKTAQSYKTRMNDLDKAIKAGTSNLDELKKQYEEVSREQGSSSAKAVRMQTEYNKQAASINRMQDELSGLKKTYAENYTTMGSFGRSIKDMGSSLKDVGSKAQSMGSTLTSAITKPALAAGTALAGIAITKGFSRLVEIDTAKAKLSALGNSAKDTSTIMDNALTSVKGTSFGLGEAATTAANAVAAGVKPGKELTQYLKNAGDAAAIAGVDMSEMGGILNKVQTSNKAYNGDLQQLADRGLPVYQWLAKEANVTAEEVVKMSSDGQISSKMLQDAIKNNIGGAAQEMGKKSFTAALSNMWAALGRVGAGFLDAGGKGGGFFSKMKPLMENLTNMFDGMQGTAEKWGQSFGNALNLVVEKAIQVKNFYQGLPGPVQTSIAEIAKWGAITLITLGPVLTMFGKATSLIGSMFGPLGTLLQKFGAVGFAAKESGSLVSGFASVFPKLGGMLSFLVANPIGIAIAAIAGLAIAFTIAYKKSETFRNIVNGALKGVAQAFQFLWNGIKAIGSALASWWNSPSGIGGILSKFWTENGPMLIQAFNNILNVAKPIFMALWNVVSTVFNSIKTVIVAVMQSVWLVLGPVLQGIGRQFMNVWNLIKATTVNVFNLIKGVIQGALNVILGIVKIFGGIFTGDWRAVWDGIKMIGLGIMQIFVSSLKFIFNQLLAFIKYIGSSIKNAFITSFTVMKGVVLGIINIFVSMAKASFNNFVAVVKFLFTGLLTAVKVIWNGIKFAILTPIRTSTALSKALFKGLVNAIVTMFSFLKNHSGAVWNAIKNVVVNAARALVNGVKTLFSMMKNSITAIFNGIKNFTIKTWTNIKNGVINLAKALYNGAKNNFNTLKSAVTHIFNAIKNFAINVWNAIKNKVVSLARGLYTAVKNHFTNLNNSQRKIFNAVKSFMLSTWSTIKSKVSNLAQGLRDGVVNKFNSLKKGTSDITSKTKSNIVNAWEKIKSKLTGLAGGIKDKVTGMFGKMRDGLKNIIDKIGDHISGMVNKVKEGLNKLIEGVNWVAGKIGMDKLPKFKFSTGTESTHTQNIVTNGKLNQDTFATVGDKGRGNGPNGFRHEMIKYPNGKMALTPNRDTTAFIPKGSTIYNGAQTHAMLNQPAFSKGTLFGVGAGGKGKKKSMFEQMGDAIGDKATDAWDATKDVAGKTIEGAKSVGKAALDKIGDVMDYMENPGKLVDKVLGAFGVDFDFVKGDLLGGLMKAAYSKLKDGVKNLFKTWLEDSGGGDADLSSFSKFGKNTPYSPNAPVPGYPTSFNGGRHYGIDYGTPAGTVIKAPTGGTVSKMHDHGGGLVAKLLSGKFTQFFLHLSEILKTGKVSKGEKFAKTGNSGAWTTGAHLHYQVEKGNSPYITNKNTVDPEKWAAGSGGSPKSGAKWASTIRKALKMNGLPTTAAYVNAWARQIDSESSGDPNATQGVKDVNSGGNEARGLVQVTPTTFASMKFPGHGNITNPLDNLLAGIHWAKYAYGSDMLGVIGHGHGYATGGVINTEGWYNLAEGGWPEIVIPTDPSKASDAMKLIAIASERVSQRGKNNKRPNQLRYPSASNNDSSDMIRLMAQQLEGQQQQIELLTKLVASTQNIEQQPKGFSERDISQAQGKRMAMQSYVLGGNL